MKKIISLGGALVSAALLSSVVCAAPANTGTVGVGAVVAFSPSQMNLKVLDIATGDDKTTTGIQFPNPSNAVPVWSTLAPETVELQVINANNWELKTYTDNFGGVAPEDKLKWGTQYGGLIDIAKVGKKVGLGWAMKSSRVPAASVTTGNPSDGKLNGFTYIKDTADLDDPATPNTDEGFHMESGYVNVAFGGFSQTNIVDPTNMDPNGGFLPTPLVNPGDPFYFYLEGNFSGASAATYGTTIHFDLVNL